MYSSAADLFTFLIYDTDKAVLIKEFFFKNYVNWHMPYTQWEYLKKTDYFSKPFSNFWRTFSVCCFE